MVVCCATCAYPGKAPILEVGQVSSSVGLEIDLRGQALGRGVFQGRQVDFIVLTLHPPKGNVHERRAVEETPKGRGFRHSLALAQLRDKPETSRVFVRGEAVSCCFR